MEILQRTTRNHGSQLLSRRKLAAVPAAVAAFGLIGEQAKAADDKIGRPATDTVVDVRQYGAKADGVTNDAPAFNTAIKYIRERQTPAGVEDIKIGPTLKIPSGVYAVSDSINLTQLRDINLLIDGDGSVILGKCAGEPVIDALGSRWLAKTLQPFIHGQAGIQIGSPRSRGRAELSSPFATSKTRARRRRENAGVRLDTRLGGHLEANL
jgi:hypothetical protein